MQLHRDTTVQSLTVTPTLIDGVISYDDSPVIKAAMHGRVLVLVRQITSTLLVITSLQYY